MIKETLDILAGTNSGIYNDFKKHEAGTALDKYHLEYEEDYGKTIRQSQKTSRHYRTLRFELFTGMVHRLLFKRATNRGTNKEVK